MNDYNKAIAYFDEWLDCYYDIDDFPPDMTPEIASIALVTLKARQRQQEQPNEPLTLEELRQMDGEVEPVFVMWRPDEDHGFAEDRWYVCGDNFRGVLDNANDGHLFDDYGKTWLAYRRKPEQEEV